MVVAGQNEPLPIGCYPYRISKTLFSGELT